MAFMQITVMPLGTGSTSVGDYVADIERFLREKGLEHSLHDMGTVVCGSPGELFQLAGELHELPFNHGAMRVVTQISVDDRRDKDRKLDEKRRAVLDRLQK